MVVHCRHARCGRAHKRARTPIVVNCLREGCLAQLALYLLVEECFVLWVALVEVHFARGPVLQATDVHILDRALARTRRHERVLVGRALQQANPTLQCLRAVHTRPCAQCVCKHTYLAGVANTGGS